METEPRFGCAAVYMAVSVFVISAQPPPVASSCMSSDATLRWPLSVCGTQGAFFERLAESGFITGEWADGPGTCSPAKTGQPPYGPGNFIGKEEVKAATDRVAVLVGVVAAFNCGFFIGPKARSDCEINS